MTTSGAVVRVKSIQERILPIRGKRVIIDADFAHFFGVPTKGPNEQVRRNKAQLPGGCKVEGLPVVGQGHELKGE